MTNHIEGRLAWDHNRVIGSVAMARGCMLSLRGRSVTRKQEELGAELFNKLLELEDMLRKERRNARGEVIQRKDKGLEELAKLAKG
jgi:hypothetical protein